MKVTLLFFAASMDATGCSRADVNLPAEVKTIGGLLTWLSGQYPLLLPYVHCLRIAQNERFASANSPIQTDDVLAVIPPVAGG